MSERKEIIVYGAKDGELMISFLKEIHMFESDQFIFITPPSAILYVGAPYYLNVQRALIHQRYQRKLLFECGEEVGAVLNSLRLGATYIRATLPALVLKKVLSIAETYGAEIEFKNYGGKHCFDWRRHMDWKPPLRSFMEKGV